MPGKDNNVTVHKCIFSEQARKVKEVINHITQKDSLSAGDTQAIRKLTEVYEVLSNPIRENDRLYQVKDVRTHD